MKDAYRNVNQLLDQIKPFLEKAGISKKRYRMPQGVIEQIPIEKYNEVFDFLHEVLMSDEWVAVLEAWQLCSAERWKFYQDYEIKGLQEQMILEAALCDLKNIWRPPAGFFGRVINENTSSNDTGENGSS